MLDLATEALTPETATPARAEAHGFAELLLSIEALELDIGIAARRNVVLLILIDLLHDAHGLCLQGADLVTKLQNGP